MQESIVVSVSGALSASLPDLPPLMVGGVALLSLIGLQLLLYLAFYRRPGPHEALVRTGFGGARVSIASGLLVAPLLQRLSIVKLVPVTLRYRFEHVSAPAWHDTGHFTGKAFVTVQVPGEDPEAVRRAARSFEDITATERVTDTLEGVVRATFRDTVRSMRQSVIRYEPSVAEVRLAQALSTALTAFGILVRAVHLEEGLDDGADSTDSA